MELEWELKYFVEDRKSEYVKNASIWLWYHHKHFGNHRMKINFDAQYETSHWEEILMQYDCLKLQ